jgi:hypothetical protein
MCRRPFSSILAALAVVALAITASLAVGPAVSSKPIVSYRTGFEAERPTSSKGIVNLQGWFVTGPASQGDESFTIEATIYHVGNDMIDITSADSDHNIVTQLDFGTVHIPAGASQMWHPFQYQLPLDRGEYGVVYRAYQVGAFRVLPDGTRVPDRRASTGRTFHVK